MNEKYILSDFDRETAARQFRLNVIANNNFLVKIQAGVEKKKKLPFFMAYPEKLMNLFEECWIYDKSRTVSGSFKDEKLANLVRLYGRLGHTGFKSKKIFLYANVDESDFTKLTIFTDVIVHNVDWWFQRKSDLKYFTYVNTR